MVQPHGGRTGCQPPRVEGGGNIMVLRRRTAALSMKQSRQDAAFRRIQKRRGEAFMPGMLAQSSKESRGGAKSLSHAAIMTILLFIETSNHFLAHRWQIHDQGIGGTGFLVHTHRGYYSGVGSRVFGKMPRDRGIPRRGGRSGVRVSSERGSVQPISPINEAPPSSDIDNSEQECLLPQGTYQSFRFRFPSRLVRPEVVVNFSVFITEEDPSCINSGSPSRAHDSDVFVGDMEGIVYRTRRDSEMFAPSVLAQPAEPREDSGNDLSIQEIMQLPNLNAVAEVSGTQAPPDPEDGMVIWIDSPSQGDSVQTDSTSQHT